MIEAVKVKRPSSIMRWAFFGYLRKIRDFVVIQHELTGYNQPEGNAHVERTIGTVKEEESWLNEYEGFFEVREGVERYIEFYNEEKIHSALGYISPMEFIKSLYAGPVEMAKGSQKVLDKGGKVQGRASLSWD